MTEPYIKVYCSKETKKLFDDFYDKNKGNLGSKANMFRVMVSNLPVLASQSNIKLSDPENKGLEEKIMELQSTMVELESTVMKKLNKVDKMIEAMFINGEMNDTESNIDEIKLKEKHEEKSQHKEGMFFTSNRLGR
ncbi:hypothetical protein [Candidatus Enterococcus courvalinii]|uniref:hypothetical protein n=1 Tax=Candidatus Enterococcus courvalinii TaxID=2815329 RepID=UPI001F5CEB45|nr:hypothetical protein [Enterococcus sp. MSG2901]